MAKAILVSIVVLSAGCLGDDDCVCEDASVTSGSCGAGGGAEAGSSGSGADAGQPAEDASTLVDATTSGADAGGTAVGRLREGEICERTTDCIDGLVCVASGTGVGYPNFCARDCERCDEDLDEACYTYTNRPGDAHCSLPQTDDYQECGPWLTTHCAEPMNCLAFSDGSGICLRFCALGEAGEGQCPEDQTCIQDVLASDTEGVCGTTVGPDEGCDPVVGVGCESGFQCSADLEDPFAVWTCRSRCSAEDTTCEEGTCTNWFEGDETAYACY